MSGRPLFSVIAIVFQLAFTVPGWLCNWAALLMKFWCEDSAWREEKSSTGPWRMWVCLLIASHPIGAIAFFPHRTMFDFLLTRSPPSVLLENASAPNKIAANRPRPRSPASLSLSLCTLLLFGLCSRQLSVTDKWSGLILLLISALD